MAALPEAVIAQHGQVNLLINNAGITYQKSFANHSIEDWETITGVNYWGVVYGCHYFLPALRDAGEAHIVNLSSMNALVGLPSQSSYCATKAAAKIITAVQRGRMRVRVGPDAVLVDILKRCFPVGLHRLLARAG